MRKLDDLKTEAIKNFCEVWRLVNLYGIEITDARSGEVLVLNNINFDDKDRMLPEEEEEDPALYEFEPGRVYWNEMAANP